MLSCVGRRNGDSVIENPRGSRIGASYITRHHCVDSGSCACTHGPSFSAQYIGRIYSAASLSKRAMPSRASLTHVSTSTVGLRKSFFAESFTRAQCNSRSGVTPSNALAPSNTTEQSHAACEREPMIGTSPSRHSPSKNVQVFDQVIPTVTLLPLHPVPWVILSPRRFSVAHGSVN